MQYHHVNYQDLVNFCVKAYVGYGFTEEEAKQECSRCLRCDHYGCATLKGGRVNKW